MEISDITNLVNCIVENNCLLLRGIRSVMLLFLG
jgi:hypothetical protein